MTIEKKPKKEITCKQYVKMNNIKVNKELKDRILAQNKIKQPIYKSIKEKPKTVPEISLETKIDSHEVLWYLSTGLRYREVVAVEKTDEDYWKYKLASGDNN